MTALASPADQVGAADVPDVFFYDVTSADGTRLRAWTNDPDCLIERPTVLLCSGLGTNPWAYPALLRPDCGVRVVSWMHRGVGGSDRPADRDRCGVEEFVEDALAVMDDAGLDQATLMGWSIGVNTMFELVLHHPARVTGLFAVAGVPGDTFATMLAPFHVPRVLAKVLTVNVTRVGKLAGPLVSPVARRLPMGPRSMRFLNRTGFMFPVPDVPLAGHAVRELLSTPVEWYLHLALRTSGHRRVSLSAVTVPTSFVAARWDVLAGSRDMASAAERIEGATYVELDGSHFIAMEKPDRVHELLLELLSRVELVPTGPQGVAG